MGKVAVELRLLLLDSSPPSSSSSLLCSPPRFRLRSRYFLRWGVMVATVAAAATASQGESTKGVPYDEDDDAGFIKVQYNRVVVFTLC